MEDLENRMNSNLSCNSCGKLMSCPSKLKMFGDYENLPGLPKAIADPYFVMIFNILGSFVFCCDLFRSI